MRLFKDLLGTAALIGIALLFGYAVVHSSGSHPGDIIGRFLGING